MTCTLYLHTTEIPPICSSTIVTHDLSLSFYSRTCPTLSVLVAMFFPCPIVIIKAVCSRGPAAVTGVHQRRNVRDRVVLESPFRLYHEQGAG